VAEEDGGELGGGGVEMQGGEVVEQVEVVAFKEDDFSFRELAAWAFAVGVATDGGDGGELAQFLEDGDFADVAEVEDGFDSGQGGSDFGTEQAVGVAQDADFHLHLFQD
jgi:hypothetical protein